ncbi:hypothetical protein FAGKG844_20095 [Frankia sp. AgKG'84/4]
MDRLALTVTRPATSAPCSSARRSVRVPPIDRPITNTCSHSSRRRRNSPRAVEYQSCQVVGTMSCQRVPCPGSRGQATVSPAAARASPQGRMLPGEPVKPCTSRTPTGPPADENGSAPGSGAVPVEPAIIVRPSLPRARPRATSRGGRGRKTPVIACSHGLGAMATVVHVSSVHVSSVHREAGRGGGTLR